ncbi:hypothetical protein H6G80_29965 [Nostoc sp. FACHB-87]|uniref:hypothetical protein n=1 Tax=Nostocaceae TaxID=1162 RepID=UPI0016834C85|nr:MULTISPECIES: hypothetical protein [Nostocaceae]MBD2303233.1 hypothetical protein [Nostoc sp. FACHB-190]MBD2458280.1 hypothetical protein [Nostoc sp. FACHB-87]MBD2480065.1 hypothetical protein [Anabaena sp. FACHB-83]
MTTKIYSVKYRQLKQIYERNIGKQISDITWYRVVAFLKQRFSLKVESANAQEIVETFAGLRRRYGALTPASKGFNERWQVFKHFYELDASYNGESFLVVLADYLKINLDDVPRSTRYYWFSQAGLSFNALNTYHSKDLALVAFVAAKWAINRRQQPMKSADPKALALAK